MIVKIHRSGRSFVGVTRYLAHDPNAKTADRVAWTHTLNLAEDTHLPTAVHEMLWTYRAADSLKRASGISTGGTRLQRPVKHLSLGWHESEQTTQAHMLQTAKAYLKHMGWDDRQAILFGHRDKPHPHVHVVLNVVSPQDGRALDDFREHWRTEAFCLAYEREHGRIFCEERLKPIEERSPSPTRATWERLKAYEREDNRAEPEPTTKDFDYFERNDPATRGSKEWQALKAHQRKAREEFLLNGKEAYRDIRNCVYREVREEYREQWRNYYEAKREGKDTEALAEMKTAVLDSQRKALDERRAVHCADLRERRDHQYAALLEGQKTERADLTALQNNGYRASGLLDALYPVSQGHNESTRVAFQLTENEVCAGEPADKRAQEREAIHDRAEQAEDSSAPHEHFKVRGPLDVVGGLGLGAFGALASMGEKLFDGFFGGGGKPAPPKAEPQRVPAGNERDIAVQAAIKHAATETREGEEAAALHASWEERKRRGRERD
jgi:hypothetical protein